MAHYAERYRVDAVLCGHIHSAAIREFGTISYYNCGDWVESCTALVEGDDGMISLVNYHSFSASGRAVTPTPTIDSARPNALVAKSSSGFNNS